MQGYVFPLPFFPSPFSTLFSPLLLIYFIFSASASGVSVGAIVGAVGGGVAAAAAFGVYKLAQKRAASANISFHFSFLLLSLSPLPSPLSPLSSLLPLPFSFTTHTFWTGTLISAPSQSHPIPSTTLPSSHSTTLSSKEPLISQVKILFFSQIFKLVFCIFPFYMYL